MLVVGVLCIPVFVVWEKKFAKRPVVPLHVRSSSLAFPSCSQANIQSTPSLTSLSFLDFGSQLLKDRTVLGCFAIACLLNCSWYLQGDYLYTVLIVSFILQLSKPIEEELREG